MRFVIDAIMRTLAAGDAFVLATIVKSEGSSPRGAGASMLVTASGAQYGTVGGGAVEYETAKHAARVLETRRSETQSYCLRPNEVADLGMICGGQAWVLFQYFPADADTTAMFSLLQAARHAGTAAFLVRRLDGGAVTDAGVLDADGLHFAARLDASAVREHCGARARIVALEDGGRLLIEPVSNGARVYLFGGGHVSQKLVPVLSYVDFRVTVCEDRAEFADPARFPAAERVVLRPFADAVASFGVSGDDYLVIMTRGHQADYELLSQALRTPATYIGCIGSRHKVAATRRRLLAEGFTEADFARVHTPIGLPILAETPEEIAVSVAGEMIRHRAEREMPLENGTGAE